jgi:hypothetical protein
MRRKNPAPDPARDFFWAQYGLLRGDESFGAGGLFFLPVSVVVLEPFAGSCKTPKLYCKTASDYVRRGALLHRNSPEEFRPIGIFGIDNVRFFPGASEFQIPPIVLADDALCLERIDHGQAGFRSGFYIFLAPHRSHENKITDHEREKNGHSF